MNIIKLAAATVFLAFLGLSALLVWAILPIMALKGGQGHLR